MDNLGNSVWARDAEELKEMFIANARAASVFAAAPEAHVLEPWRDLLRSLRERGADVEFLDAYQRLLDVDSLQSLWETGACRLPAVHVGLGCRGRSRPTHAGSAAECRLLHLSLPTARAD